MASKKKQPRKQKPDDDDDDEADYKFKRATNAKKENKKEVVPPPKTASAGTKKTVQPVASTKPKLEKEPLKVNLKNKEIKEQTKDIKKTNTKTKGKENTDDGIFGIKNYIWW
jgi:hypothetical protein